MNQQGIHRISLKIITRARYDRFLHHRIEKWAIVKLMEKNKRVRQAAAKLTIAKLESGNRGP